MKMILSIVCFCIVTVSFAEEVKTDCLAMNEHSREKLIKTEKPKTQTKSSTASKQ